MSQKLHVLIVDDSEQDAALVVLQLTKDGFAPVFERVDTPEGLSAALDKSGWEIIISDYIMPQFSGLDALEMVRQKDQYVPFIVVSGKIGEDTAVNVMKAGADDYFMKDKLKRLGAAIQRALLEAENRRERRRAEQALRESEANLVQAQEIAHLGNWKHDIKTGQVRWSEELYRIYGLDPKQTGVKGLESLLTGVNGDSCDQIKKYLEDATHCKKASEIEYRLVRPDGEERVVLSRTLVLFDPKGKAKELVGTVLDITERKEAEEALIGYQETLRSLASQVSLAEEKERRRIAVGIHDSLSQSLASCIMQTQFLQKHLPAGETSDSLKEITEILRGLAKETRSLTFELSSPILYDLGLEAALRQLVKEMGDKHKLTTTFDGGGVPKTLKSDVPVLLYQTVRELLINVTKHAKASQVRVLTYQTGGTLEIAVEDNGIGFDPSLASSDKKSGGFGLFSIRERMKVIGGQLDIESSPGKGSRVCISLPVGE